MRVFELSELLPAERIIRLETDQKTPALQALLDVLASSGAISERVAVEQAILSREVLMSTGVGYGIAVPHARLGSVAEFAMALGVSERGIRYSSIIDDKPVKLVCMIVGPSGQHEEYLRIFAMVMRFLKSEKGRILAAWDLDEVARLTEGYDTA